MHACIEYLRSYIYAAKTLTDVDVVAIEDIPPIMRRRKHNFKIEHGKSRLIQRSGFKSSLNSKDYL